MTMLKSTGRRLKISPAADGSLVLSGTVNSLQDASKAQQLATSYVGDETKVVNALAIGERQQVLIQVRVSEMSRTVAKQFGVNLNAAVNVGGVPVLAGTANQFSLVGRALTLVVAGADDLAGLHAAPSRDHEHGPRPMVAARDARDARSAAELSPDHDRHVFFEAAVIEIRDE